MSKWCLEEFIDVSWQDERCVVKIGRSCFVVERRNGDGNPVWRWLGGAYCGHHNVVKALVDFNNGRDRGEFSEVDRLHFESFSEKLCWLVSDFEKLMKSELAQQAQMMKRSHEEIIIDTVPLVQDVMQDRFVCLFTSGSGFTRIGVSSDPIQREKQLKKEDPSVCLLAYGNGGFDVDRRLKAIFSHKRVIGCWFDLS